MVGSTRPLKSAQACLSNQRKPASSALLLPRLPQPAPVGPGRIVRVSAIDVAGREVELGERPSMTCELNLPVERGLGKQGQLL